MCVIVNFFTTGGHHTFVGFINSFVHCLLYGYYFLSLYDPTFKVAWWKKYITIVQIVSIRLPLFLFKPFPPPPHFLRNATKLHLKNCTSNLQ